MSGRAGTNRAGKSNKEIGNRFESEMSKILGENGFWCHVMQQNKSGQPADLIAVKGRYHVLIDCKEMSHDRFEFYRVEENQRLAMQRFYERGGQIGWFALMLPDGEIRMLSLPRVLLLEHDGRKSIGGALLTDCTWTLQDWLNDANGSAFDENNDQ